MFKTLLVALCTFFTITLSAQIELDNIWPSDTLDHIMTGREFDVHPNLGQVYKPRYVNPRELVLNELDAEAINDTTTRVYVSYKGVKHDSIDIYTNVASKLDSIVEETDSLAFHFGDYVYRRYYRWEAPMINNTNGQISYAIPQNSPYNSTSDATLTFLDIKNDIELVQIQDSLYRLYIYHSEGFAPDAIHDSVDIVQPDINAIYQAIAEAQANAQAYADANDDVGAGGGDPTDELQQITQTSDSTYTLSQSGGNFNINDADSDINNERIDTVFFSGSALRVIEDGKEWQASFAGIMHWATGIGTDLFRNSNVGIFDSTPEEALTVVGTTKTTQLKVTDLDGISISPLGMTSDHRIVEMPIGSNLSINGIGQISAAGGGNPTDEIQTLSDPNSDGIYNLSLGGGTIDTNTPDEIVMTGDWNDVAGKFKIIGGLANGPPVGSSFGAFFPHSNTAYGTFLSGRNGRFFMRSKNLGIYTSWAELFHSANLSFGTGLEYSGGELRWKATTNTDWNVNTTEFTLLQGSNGPPIGSSFGAFFPHTSPDFGTFLSGRNDRFFLRSKDAGAFLPWREIWHDGNLTFGTGLSLSGGVLSATSSTPWLNSTISGSPGIYYNNHVGIGTTPSPIADFTVDGDCYFPDGTFFGENNNAGSNGQVWTNTVNGMAWADAPTSIQSLTTPTVYTIGLTNANTVNRSWKYYTSARTVDSGISIGIGTNPSQPLDVNGNVRFRNEIYDYDNSPGTEGQVFTISGGKPKWTDSGSNYNISCMERNASPASIPSGTSTLTFNTFCVGANLSATVSNNEFTVTSTGAFDLQMNFNLQGSNANCRIEVRKNGTVIHNFYHQVQGSNAIISTSDRLMIRSLAQNDVLSFTIVNLTNDNGQFTSFLSGSEVTILRI